MSEPSHGVENHRSSEVEYDVEKFVHFVLNVVIVISAIALFSKYPSSVRSVSTVNSWLHKSAERERHCDFVKQRVRSVRTELEDTAHPDRRELAKRRFWRMKRDSTERCAESREETFRGLECEFARREERHYACLIGEAKQLEHDIANRRRGRTVADARTLAIVRDRTCSRVRWVAEDAAEAQERARKLGFRWDGFNEMAFAAQEFRICVDEPVTTMLLDTCWYEQDYECLRRIAREVANAIPDKLIREEEY